MDEEFRHPRLAAIYDALDPVRDDLLPYVALLELWGARAVADVGCGTGTFALLLARRGYDVVAVDPARASLEIARTKPDADRVRWVEGDATALTERDRDVVTMTANVAQSIADDDAWHATLDAARLVLRPGGALVFETRDPAARAWEGWTRDRTRRTATVAGDEVDHWVETTEVRGPLVTLRWTFVFGSDAETLTSESTLRFRDRAELAADLAACGFDDVGFGDAPDRPGRELLVTARRPS